MIDEIFALMMKEARSRKGNDMIHNIYSVFMDIAMRTMAVMDHLREEERRKKKDEMEKRDTPRRSDKHR